MHDVYISDSEILDAGIGLEVKADELADAAEQFLEAMRYILDSAITGNDPVHARLVCLYNRASSLPEKFRQIGDDLARIHPEYVSQIETDDAELY